MKRILTTSVLIALLSMGMIGCGDKASSTKETTVSTPGGTTTTTESKEVKQTGDHPPAPAR